MPIPATTPQSSGGSPHPRLAPPQAPRRGVLHLWWDGTSLQAWAEAPVRDPFHLLRGGPGAPLHPTALGGSDLARLLGLPVTARRAPAPLVLRLPARPARTAADSPGRWEPVPAPEAGGPAEGEFPLVPFTIPGLAVPDDVLAGLLFGPVGRPGVGGDHPWGETPPDLALGGDARFLRQVAQLALALCAAGRFAPGLLRRHGVPTPAWLPLWPPAAGPGGVPGALAHRLGEWRASLAAAVPPACLAVRAAVPEPGGRAGPLAAPEASDRFVAEFVAFCVDLCVRRSLRAVQARMGRGLRGHLPAERWALGLLASRPLPLQAPRLLLGEIEAWGAAAAEAPAPAVRLILRLDDPEPAASAPAAAARWPLTGLLQVLESTGRATGTLWPLAALFAPDAPAEVRRLRGGAITAVQAAARCFAPLARALPSLDAASLELSGQEAVELLETAQVRLRAAGVEVVVPSWWRPEPEAPSARLHLGEPAASAGSALSLQALTAFRWEVALGGEPVSVADFEALVRSHEPLVRLRSGWVRVDGASLAALAQQWEETGAEGRLPALTLLRLALEVGAARAGDGSGPLPVALEAGGAVGEWLQRLGAERRAEALPEPAGFVGRLRPYQRQGLGWLAFLAEVGLGGCLADDMGLGKTVQVLALLLHRRRRTGAGRPGPSLLVCPTSVVGNWQAEARRFAPDLGLHLHYGAARAHGAALRAAVDQAALVLTSYGLLARDREELAGVDWDGVILDEAQNVKNPLARQAQAARALPARYRFALTGTPVENSVRDLWALFSFALPGYLGGGRSFTREYAGPIGGGDQAVAARLRRAIAPFVLRRTKRDPGVADELPPKIEVRQDCPLTAEQAALYAAVVRQSLERIETSRGLVRRAAVLTTLLRLKQICDHPGLYLADGAHLEGRSGKLRRLEELLEDVLGEGERGLVFTQFATWARRLAPYLAGRFDVPVQCLDGSVPGPARAELVRAFQEGEGPGLFVLSLKAGGAGLNLTAAQHVFHYDRWWNPAVEAQATDRAHRLGQTRSVQVHRLIAPGTLEERIDALIASKRQVAEQVVGSGAGEAWLTELSTEALRDLLSLGPGGRAEA